MLGLMKAWHYRIDFKKTIAKIRKRTALQKQPLDNKLFKMYDTPLSPSLLRTMFAFT